MEMTQLEYLERLSTRPNTLTLHDRLEYLETCYLRDSLSSESREMLAADIQKTKDRIAAS